MNRVAQDRPEDEGRAKIRLQQHEEKRRACEDSGADDPPERPEATHPAPEVVGEHDDHQDLRDLAELELEPEDRHPSRLPPTPPPIASVTPAGRARRVDRPGERLQPVVVAAVATRNTARASALHISPRMNRAALEDAVPRSPCCCRPSRARRQRGARRRRPAGSRRRARPCPTRRERRVRRRGRGSGRVSRSVPLSRRRDSSCRAS